MNSDELIRKIKKLARKQGVKFRIDAKRGKGSHMHIYFGSRVTTIPSHKTEIPTGTMMAVLKQLGIDKKDI